MNKNLSLEEIESFIIKVSNAFYEHIYQHPWLKQVFQVPQEHITSQQIDFMLGAFGGPQRYCGRNPGDAHPHIYIDEQMWQLRHELLQKAFDETNCPNEMREKWLKIEEAFKKRIVMSNPSECQRRYTTDELIIIRRAG